MHTRVRTPSCRLGLAQLLQPLADEIPVLPPQQAETLQAVRGLSAEQPAELLAIANDRLWR